MAQSVLKTVIARYKTIFENQKEWMKPIFKKLQYDLEQKLIYKAKQSQSIVIIIPLFVQEDIEVYECSICEETLE